MWKLGAAAALFAALELLVNAWYRGARPSLYGFAAGLGVSLAAGFALDVSGLSCGWIAGGLCGLAVSLFGFDCRRQAVGSRAFLFCVGAAGAVVPLCFVPAVPSLACYVCGAVLLAVMALSDLIADRRSQPETGWNESPAVRPEAFLPLVCPALTAALLFPFEPMPPVRAVLVFAVLTAAAVLLLWLQDLIVRERRLREENAQMNRWHAESRDYMNTIRSQRHDFNLHMHAISGLIGSGQYEECGTYVQKLVANAASVNDIMPVADAVVGSMLYNMREEARRRGSDIQYSITYDLADIVCSGFECNKILGNLLQNAIDALQTPEDKACGIRMRIFKRRGNAVVTVENRFSGDPAQIAAAFEAGHTTKKNHDGIGLTMVLRTAEKYGGRVYPEFEDGLIRFVLNIPNRVTLKGEGEA